MMQLILAPWAFGFISAISAYIHTCACMYVYGVHVYVQIDINMCACLYV